MHKATPNTYANLFANSVFAMSLVIILSNIGANKITAIFGLSIDCSFMFFPLTYLIVDIVNEKLGVLAAKRVVFYGFLASFIVTAGIFIIKVMPEYYGWHNQEALDKYFQLSSRVAVASLSSYLIGLYLNANVFAYLKAKSESYGLLVRFFLSTVVSAFVENTIFYFLAFWGLIAFKQLMIMILMQYAVKVVYNLLCSYIAVKLFLKS